LNSINFDFFLTFIDYKFSGVGTEGLGFALDALDIKQALGIE
jgi:hypothetical protein